MPNNIEELIAMIAKRDGITSSEARAAVQDVVGQFFAAVDDSEPLETFEDILREELGLEPDYLQIFFEELFG